MYRALKAYQAVAETSLSGREAEAACFMMLIDELKAVQIEGDHDARIKALDRHQKLWSLIMKANIVGGGRTQDDDRALIIDLADKAQRYGIQAILNSAVSLDPLIDIAQDVLDGLQAPQG